MIKTICICGAGTMGSGLTQVCAQSGFDTILFDVNENMLEKAKQNTKKYKIDYLDRQAILDRAKELKTSKFTEILKDYYLKEIA